MIPVKDQKVFQPRIIMLLCLVKNTRPGIVNTTWEISKVLDGTNLAEFLEIHLMIKYVFHEESWA